MPAQMLIYESAAPVSFGRHGQWSVEVGADYAFSKHVNSIPLIAVEFPNAASEYSIVFAGTEEAVVPAVILGMRNDENLFSGAVPDRVPPYPGVLQETGRTETSRADARPG